MSVSLKSPGLLATARATSPLSVALPQLFVQLRSQRSPLERAGGAPYLSSVSVFIIFMHLFKQQAIFQLDRLPHRRHGLPRGSASLLGRQGPGRASAEGRDRRRRGNGSVVQPHAACSHLWMVPVHLPPWRKALGLQNRCWIFLRRNSGLIS